MEVAAFPRILKVGTGVVEVTVKGAVPVETVETNWVPVTDPEATTDVGVMAPNPMVRAGVGVAIDQVAVTPLFAAAVETEVTVPVVELS